jgi:hypothetical protein
MGEFTVITLRRLAMLVLAVFAAAAALAGSTSVDGAVAAEPKSQAATVFSWQQPHAKVLPNGGLEWAPKPFVFEKGDSARYIDFEAGDDARDGKTQQTAWKHHPWDAAATGEAKACTGVQTYVFKGGVVYRGALTAAESGTPDNPIRLTRDPDWGKGEAIFYGSTQIKGGWKKANAEEAPGIPQPDNIWYIDLGKSYDPDPNSAKFSSMWQVDGDRVERLHIARTPQLRVLRSQQSREELACLERLRGENGHLHVAVSQGLGR